MNNKENPIVIIPTIQPMMVDDSNVRPMMVEDSLVRPMMVEETKPEWIKKSCGNCDKCKCPK
jgi:hypothetical protein